MVDVKKLKPGDSVYYKPPNMNGHENGVVKSITPNGGVFVVYNCNGEWHKYMEYTAANTRPEDLFTGWKY
jgi:hypothetical protein